MPVQIDKAGAEAREMARRRAIRICLAIISFIVLGSMLIFVGNRLLRFDSWFAYLAGMLTVGLGIGLLVAVIKVSTGKDGKEISHGQSGGKCRRKNLRSLGRVAQKIRRLQRLPLPHGEYRPHRRGTDRGLRH